MIKEVIEISSVNFKKNLRMELAVLFVIETDNEDTISLDTLVKKIKEDGFYKNIEV